MSADTRQSPSGGWDEYRRMVLQDCQESKEDIKEVTRSVGDLRIVLEAIKVRSENVAQLEDRMKKLEDKVMNMQIKVAALVAGGMAGGAGVFSLGRMLVTGQW